MGYIRSKRIRDTSFLLLGCIIVLFFTALNCSARVMTPTLLLSTQLEDIRDDKSLVTKNNMVFYPVNDAYSLTVKEGTEITIRYVKKNTHNYYIEVAPGAGSLQPLKESNTLKKADK